MPAQDPGELFDLCDRDGAPLGRRKPRSEVHRDGDWHRSLHIWVALREGPDLPHAPRSPHLLFQRRSPEKDTWPGALDVAVAGHLRAGETVLDGLREAREEIGLELGPSDVVRLGLRRSANERGAIRDRELQEIFATATSLPLAFFQPDPDEVTSLVVIEIEAAWALFRGERAEARAWERRTGDGAPTEFVVRAADFVPAADGYYTACLRSLGAWLQGCAETAWILG